MGSADFLGTPAGEWIPHVSHNHIPCLLNHSSSLDHTHVFSSLPHPDIPGIGDSVCTCLACLPNVLLSTATRV